MNADTDPESYIFNENDFDFFGNNSQRIISFSNAGGEDSVEKGKLTLNASVSGPIVISGIKHLTLIRRVLHHPLLGEGLLPRLLTRYPHKILWILKLIKSHRRGKGCKTTCARGRLEAW